MSIEEEYLLPDLGTCCSCGKGRAEGAAPRNILLLKKRSPIPGHGWGCIECERPSDGATAVKCDPCFAAYAPLRFACRGYPGEEGRIPIDELEGTFDHNHMLHLVKDPRYQEVWSQEFDDA